MKIIRYFSILVSLVFGFIIFSGLPIYANAASILSDDFNAYSNGNVVGQGGWFNRANGLPYVIQGQEGKKALYNNNTGADSVITKTISTALPNGNQYFWIRTENRSGWGSYNIGENFQLGLFQGSWDGSSRATLAFMKDGHVAILDTVTDKYVNFDTYTDNSWTLVEAEWRISDKTIRWRVNDGVWTNWIPFVGSTSFTGFDTIGFVTFYLGSGGVYIDNLGIASVPPAITPLCTVSSWQCGDWDACTASGLQNRTCNKISICDGGVSAPATSQSCTYTPPCTSNDYSCSDWSSCSTSGNQTRSCTKTSNCSDGTQMPLTSQSCTAPIPPIPTPTPRSSCLEDTWSCGDWNVCSLSGVQSRSCRKTFDCSAVEDGAPATSRSCISQETSPQPNQGESIDRDQIFRATVKLLCPTSKTEGWQGSGTIIDQYGTILTNRHVIQGTIGLCRVGFINNEDDIPVYLEVADVKKVSVDRTPNGDMALLKIRNFGNKQFTAIDILKGNSGNLKSGDLILPFGYPREEDFGDTITSTEGPYSGKGTTITVNGVQYSVSGFFKTTATIEHGSSGGGAYQKKTGLFMGIPTLGVNKANYILSVNTIKNWLSSIGGNYNVSANNYSNLGNYLSSPVKIEDINLSNLRVLDAPTSIEIISGKTEEKSKNQKVVVIPTSPKTNQVPEESIVIEPNDANQKINSEQNNQVTSSPVTQPQPKASLVKRFINWVTHFFGWF